MVLPRGLLKKNGPYAKYEPIYRAQAPFLTGSQVPPKLERWMESEWRGECVTGRVPNSAMISRYFSRRLLLASAIENDEERNDQVAAPVMRPKSGTSPCPTKE